MQGQSSGSGAPPPPRADSAPTSAEPAGGPSGGASAAVPKRPLSVAESDPGVSIHRRFQAGQVISGRYRLERMIARGGMGCVFLATQLPLARRVAVKFLTVQEPTREFRQRFLLEASTCARLVHRHIVTVHDYGETPEGELYMAMEYLAGEPLSKAITRAGRFPAERACRVALQVCRALRAAHLAGVVHRDLKPSNVMVLEDEDEDGHLGGDFVKVLDFGLVKAAETKDLPPEADAEPLELTRAGVLLGSPRYMAPEQIRSEPVTPATDVYALGVLLFHMVAGRPPFLGANSVEILNQHLKDRPPELASVAPDAEPMPEVEAIIRRCLEKSPSARFASMEELIAELKAAYRLIAGLSLGSDPLPEASPDEVIAAGRLSSVLRSPTEPGGARARSYPAPPAAPSVPGAARAPADPARWPSGATSLPSGGPPSGAVASPSPEEARPSRPGAPAGWGRAAVVVGTAALVMVIAFLAVRAFRGEPPTPAVKDDAPSARRVAPAAPGDRDPPAEALQRAPQEAPTQPDLAPAPRRTEPAPEAREPPPRRPPAHPADPVARPRPARADATGRAEPEGSPRREPPHTAPAEAAAVAGEDAPARAPATTPARVRTVDEGQGAGVVDRTRVVPVVDEPVPTVR